MGWSKRIALLLIASITYRWVRCAPSIDDAEKTLGVTDPLSPAILHHVLHTEPNNQLRLLSAISDDDSYLKRTFLDPAHRRAAETLQTWMHQAGLESWVDGLANVRGRAPAEDAASPALLIGSHYDTVVDAGAYDGALGIIVGIAAAKANMLSAAVTAGIVTNEDIFATIGHDPAHGDMSIDDGTLIDVEAVFRRPGKPDKMPRLRKPVQVVAFCDEEGVRFQSTFLGSRGLVGDVTEAYLDRVVDRQGVTLRDAIKELEQPGKSKMDEKNNTEGNVIRKASATEDVLRVAVGRQELAGYVEVHIEQGPVLEAAGERLGVVTGVAGQTWIHVEVQGSQGHAGTVPMGVRRDPMPAVGGLVYSLEQLCADKQRQTDSNGSLVCTVGKLEVWPGASNVIPGSVNFTVDVRALSDELRKDVVAEFRQTVDDVCRQRQLECEFKIRHEAGAVAMDEHLTEALVGAVRKVESQGSDGGDDAHTCTAAAQKEVIRMPSGAGHDAIAMASIVPVSMLFVRCKGGISHHPDEYAHPDDVAAAARATYHLIRDWQLQ